MKLTEEVVDGLSWGVHAERRRGWGDGGSQVVERVLGL